MLVLQGIGNSRAIVHHLQHLQGLDKKCWQFGYLYFFVDSVESIQNIPSGGDTLFSTQRLQDVYIYIYVHDTAAIVVGYCHTCWILLATDRESPSSLRVFQDFLHQPSYLRFSTRQMRTCKWVNRKTAKQDSSSKNWD